MGNSKKLPNKEFDYQKLDSQTSLVIQQRTGEIKERLQRSAQDIWEIGKCLAEVREKLKYGQFQAWLKSEFDWSRRMAYNFIQVYETFDSRANLAQVSLASSVLYLLAAPSTPQEVREEVLHQAKEGQKVTYSKVREALKVGKTSSESAIVTKENSDLPKKNLTKSEIEIIDIVFPKKTTTIDDNDDSSDSIELKTIIDNTDQLNPETIKQGWYLVGGENLIYCGDTASETFIKRLSFDSLGIAVTGDDWDHDWLVEKVKTLVVMLPSELKEQTVERLIELLTTPEETVVFPWLANPQMLSVTHSLGRKFIAGDRDAKKCSEAIAKLGLPFQYLGNS